MLVPRMAMVVMMLMAAVIVALVLVARMAVMLMHQSMPLPAGNKPAVDGKRRQARQNKRERKASPKTEFRKPGIHGPGNHEHDKVIDNLHGGNGKRVRGKGKL